MQKKRSHIVARSSCRYQYCSDIVSIPAKSPLHCGEIKVLFFCDAATLLLSSVRSFYALYTLIDLDTTKALRRGLCYLGIANLTLQLCSWHSGQLQAWFKWKETGLLLIIRNFVVYDWRGFLTFLFLKVLRIGCIISL